MSEGTPDGTLASIETATAPCQPEDAQAAETSPIGAEPPNEVLPKNRALQEELRRVVSLAEKAREKNDEMRRLCTTVIQTRQQQARKKRTARPIKAPMMQGRKDRQMTDTSQLTCSFWSVEGKEPSLSEESRRMKSILSYVPSSFRYSSAWSAQETQSLCYAILSLAQEKLSQRIFASVLEDEESSVEQMREGIAECRRLRLDSSIALEAVRGFSNDDWQLVCERLVDHRSALECSIQWKTFVRPDRNQRPFTREEATTLQTIAEARSLSNWEEISKELGTERHPAECLRFYRQHFRIPSRLWTKEDDKKLLQTWKEGGQHALKLLTVEMGRDFRVVMARARHLQKETELRRGKWDIEEDLKLLKAVLRHGLSWDAISEDVPRRSAAQCRERFTYSLQPSLTRQRGAQWTPEDTDKLKVLAEKHLQDYGKIKWALLAKSFEGISARDLLNKWNRILEQTGV